MSTFDGRVAEFPDIRIDYFRSSQDSSETPPLAYFLSHVHSDHLVGLETSRSYFIYCSPATRDILLRLEKYPHRMNFAKGILESRCQTYKHLKKQLKAIPLETPTVIELAPGKVIRVSLFDANHCVGAVGFLIEGDGKAVFYSGDVRAETWWVEASVRSPLIVPFTVPGGKRLDCVYLDTTFATKGESGRYRKFPSKAEGLRELVGKVLQYSKNTLFYYDSWTFGYEDVWQTLSTVLHAKVHVDDYRYSLYRALKNGAEPKAPEANQLMGFWCGNHYQEGCLTDQWSRLHSCEYGTGCSVWTKDFVRITPIISRHKGMEMRELGAGGGKGDLNPKHELEFGDAEMILQMLQTHEANLKGQSDMLSNMWKTVAAGMGKNAQALSLDVPALGLTSNDSTSQPEDVHLLDDLALDRLLPALAKWMQNGNKIKDPIDTTTQGSKAEARHDALPKQITFPFSRHSSYSELCALIAALKPRDIYPCTVDSVQWDPAQHSMEALFGHLYDESELPTFLHDRRMMKKLGNRQAEYGDVDLQPWRPYRGVGKKRERESEGIRWEEQESPERDVGDDGIEEVARPAKASMLQRWGDEDGEDGQKSPVREENGEQAEQVAALAKTSTAERNTLTSGEASYAWRKEVHDSALGSRGKRWEDVEMVSVAGHQEREVEL